MRNVVRANSGVRGDMPGDIRKKRSEHVPFLDSDGAQFPAFSRPFSRQTRLATVIRASIRILVRFLVMSSSKIHSYSFLDSNKPLVRVLSLNFELRPLLKSKFLSERDFRFGGFELWHTFTRSLHISLDLVLESLAKCSFASVCGWRIQLAFAEHACRISNWDF
jgi:hypothetical protein